MKQTEISLIDWQKCFATEEDSLNHLHQLIPIQRLNDVIPIDRLNSVLISRNDHRVCSAVVDAFRPRNGQKEHPPVNALVA